MRMRTWLMGVLALLSAAWLFLALPAEAQRGPGRANWIKLGEQTVGFQVDSDVFEISRQDGRLRALKVVVRGNDIFLINLRIFYGNGTEEDVTVNQPVRANSETRALDLRGEARFIQRVEMTYRSRPGFAGRAVAELWGDAADDPRHDVVPPGYVELDVQRVNPSADRIIVPVGREEGRHTKIRLRVLDESLFIRRLNVVYGNGQTEEIALREALPPGAMTRDIDLSGDRRFIREIIVSLRPQPGARRPARLQVLGDVIDSRRPPSFAQPVPLPNRPPLLTEVPRGWVLFGSQTVGFTQERDVIRVGRDIGRFQKIALRVLRNDIFLREMVLVYARGETQVVTINAEIRANSLTPAVHMQREGRLSEIQLVYQARPGFRGQAVVEVYGEYAASWLGDRGDGRSFNRGWVLLGAQRAEMLTSDRDVFHVGRQFGAFRAVKVAAKKHAVTLHGMRITYANGESEDVAVPRELKGGAETPPIDLRGRERFIETIELRYRTKLNLKGDAVVEVWGQH